MSEGYHHLTGLERCQIEALRKVGTSSTAIAEHLGYDRSTVCREIKRNAGHRGYRHKQAQREATARRREASSVPYRLTQEVWAEIQERLREGWSPEQISGRFRMEGRPIGRQIIYDRIRGDRKAGGDLWKSLRRRGKKRNWRGGRHAGRGHIPNRVDISERPGIVEEKTRIGDWEADTIIGKAHSGAVVSLVDRVTKYTLLARVERKTAAAVGASMIGLLGSDDFVVHTITSDNGKEFATHMHVARALDADFFFARPYHSWERGLNEHTNGLCREYFPKDTDFRQVTDAEISALQDRLNARPRKVLGYRTPAEAMFGLAMPP